jgi:hypothetical protein
LFYVKRKNKTMKPSIIVILLLFSVIYSSFGQDIVDVPGQTITGPVTWNYGDIYYINGNITISTTGSLTIVPNTTGLNAPAGLPVHVASTANYGFTINGAGVITVTGTSSRNIIFTANYDRDEYYGEANEVWHNMFFSGATGVSVIDYAIFEYGTGNSGYGGAMNIAGRNITVRNSTVHDCKASSRGGGIFLSPTGTVTLQNLKIYNNTATTYQGGGICVLGSTTVSINECEFYNNSSGGVGDGIYFSNASSVRNSLIYNHSGGEGVYFTSGGNLVNCDVINNATGVTSASSTAPVLLNTVLWGNGTEYTINSGANLTLANCGIEGGLSGGTDGGGNVNLSSTNDDATGPNFVNPTTDLHIGTWITPLVDGGAASYGSVTAPSTDMDDNSRISGYDIGADEFIYFIWTGTLSDAWSASGNWTGSPSSIPTSFSEDKIIIPVGCTNYPTVSDITLSSRSRLEIAPNAGLTVTGATTVNSGCTFLLQSETPGSLANFITGSSVGTGSYTVEMFLTGGGSPIYNWHFVTTPVDGIVKAVLTTDIGNSYNLMNYDETDVLHDRNGRWQWHDSYNGTTGFDYLFNTRGYNVYVSSDQKAVFTGTILSGQDFTYNLTCGNTDYYENGWNLIGNPFTSGVDAYQAFTFGANVEPTIYFTTGNNYVTYNTFTGGSTGGSNLVPSLQGFFVHATYTENPSPSDLQVTIPASCRIYSTSTLYKGAHEVSGEYPVLKFNVSDGASSADEALIYFFKDATASFDRNYDAFKLFSQNPAFPQIYSTSEDIKLALNGLPYPDTKTEVPLKLRIGEAKNYTINVLKIDKLDNYKVTLIHGDKKIDLKTNPAYSFYAPTGTINDMSVVFENISTDIIVSPEEQTAFWYSNGSIMIKTGLTGFEDNSSVVIHDMSGKIVFNKNNVTITRGEIFELPVNLSRGIYIITLSNNSLRVTRKIVITSK